MENQQTSTTDYSYRDDKNGMPTYHPFETDRLNSLYNFSILDSLPEPEFDAVTELARSVFNVPICLVSLLDKERQWFKSHPGLNCSSTPRSLAFCNLTQRPESEAVTVIDPFNDYRFKNNPLVTSSPHIRWYAGAPLIIDKEKKLSVGSFCLIDTKRRNDFSEADKAKLVQFAEIVVRMMKARTRYINVANAHCRNLFSVISHMLKNPMHILLNAPELTNVTDLAQPSRDRDRDREVNSDTAIVDEIGRQGENMWTLISNLVSLQQANTSSDSQSKTPSANHYTSAIVSLDPPDVDIAKFFTDLLYQYRLGFDPIRIHHIVDASVGAVNLSRHRAEFHDLIHECLVTAVNRSYCEEQDKIRLTLQRSENDLGVLSFNLYFKAKPRLQVPPRIQAIVKDIDPTGTVGIETDIEEPRLWFKIKLAVFHEHVKKRKIEDTALHASSDNSNKYKNVIVVACDDEPLTRMLLKRMILRCGVQEKNLFVFSDGDEVLKFVASRREMNLRLPDLGCFDIVMQRICGDKCVKLLREDEYVFPVIAATGCNNVEELLNNGFDHVVTKPYKW
eukprot:CAMPEP_0204822764 /NCGR_PEP_ID=MMETSP1346-20131115/950_1 /ASSEMBLY_ACC=CAM_ASM_000771 /TAXON_ID=215587 /ORGANISM="Aplanochytrium stocchinoi, Strain GSBS06" /LENGTH=561 /DNA_ID=CAMNT_0051949147 /DNA_START=111 /DNA_END=1793 /DNA_ORIENTATION=-